MGTIFSACGILSPKGVCSIFMTMNDEMTVIARRGVRLYFIAFFPMGQFADFILSAVSLKSEKIVVHFIAPKCGFKQCGNPYVPSDIWR